MTVALATIPDLEAVAGGVDDVGAAERLLEMASATVAAHCRRRFHLIDDDPVAFTVVDGVLLVTSGPVRSVASVTDPDGATVDAEAFEVGRSLPGGIVELVRVMGSWADGDHQVVYSHGFDPIPDDVVQVVCMAVARHMAADLALTHSSLGGYSEGYRDSAGSGVRLTGEDRAVLRPYRARLSTVQLAR